MSYDLNTFLAYRQLEQQRSSRDASPMPAMRCRMCRQPLLPSDPAYWFLKRAMRFAFMPVCAGQCQQDAGKNRS